jgi:hypothetical protein
MKMKRFAFFAILMLLLVAIPRAQDTEVPRFSNWAEPENVGDPINSAADDAAPLVTRPAASSHASAPAAAQPSYHATTDIYSSVRKVSFVLSPTETDNIA